MDNFHALDWLAIAGYLAIALSVGVVMTRRASRSMEDFYLAGRSLNWFIAGTSMVATSFAVDTPLLITGWVRRDGIVGNWFWWSFAVGGCLLFVVLGAYWRRLGVVTDAEVVERRYGGAQARGLRVLYGSYHALITNTLVLAWVLKAMVKIVTALLDLPPGEYDLYIVGGSVLFALGYSLLSGLWGVALTDMFQFVISMIGAIALAWIVVSDLGGLGEFQDLVADMDEEKTKLLPIPEKGEDGWEIASFWTMGFMTFAVFAGVMGWLNKNADGNGVYVQRFSACRTEEHARGSALWFHVAHYALRPWPWIIVAIVSLKVFRDGELPILESTGGPDHEAAYPMMVVEYLSDHPGLFGLVCVSFLSAFMSTLDTHMNVGSAYLVNDIYRRFLKPEAGATHYVWVGRACMVLIAAIGSFIAQQSDTIIGLFELTLSLLAGIGPALLMRWFWWRANAFTEISALITSSATTLYLKQMAPDSMWPSAPFNDFAAGTPWNFAGQYLVIVTASTLVMLLVTFLTPAVEKAHLRKFFLEVRPLGRWQKVRRDGKSTMEKGALFNAVFVWLGGIAFVLGLTLLIGAILLGQPWVVYLLVCFGGGLFMATGWGKAVPPALD